MNANCSICGASSYSRTVDVRGNKRMNIYHCEICDFDFFDKDPTKGLADDKLDESRLKSVGLDIPTIENDFANGIIQSKPYIEKFVDESDKGKNILEIGCSFGYFLQLLKDYGAIPYGVELNLGRTQYVNEHLGISCFETLEECEAQQVKFKKMFLFYVLEYIPDPVNYFMRLINMLEDGGTIIVISPNLEDFLKDGWQNPGFIKFFYDEYAINYFTVKATRRFAELLPVKNFDLYTKQGYSFLNHTSWYLTNAPRTTGIVGGDTFVDNIIELINTSSVLFKEEMIELIRKFDNDYKQLIQNYNCGNRIFLILKK